jgi:hypothetical protein
MDLVLAIYLEIKMYDKNKNNNLVSSQYGNKFGWKLNG